MDSKVSDQTGGQPSLIRVFAGHTGNIDVFFHENAHLASDYAVVVYVDLANLFDLLLYASKKSLSF